MDVPRTHSHPMNSETPLYDVEDGLAVITLNCPDELNALSRALLEELERCLMDAGQTSALRFVVLMGTGETATRSCRKGIGAFSGCRKPIFERR